LGRGKYSREQILAILKEHEAGTPIADLCCTYGMRSETFYAWKPCYTGVHNGEEQKLWQMFEENAGSSTLSRMWIGFLGIANPKESKAPVPNYV
jgi:putative transposase